MMEYITCSKCKKQQKRDNFWYGFMRHEVCKFCNKKTNIIPGDYTVTTEQVFTLLSQVVFDYDKPMPMDVQMKLQPVFTFLKRQVDREKEIRQDKVRSIPPSRQHSSRETPKVGMVCDAAQGTTDDSIHQEKCGDTPTRQHCSRTHPEEGQVSTETEGATGDSKSKEESK